MEDQLGASEGVERMTEQEIDKIAKDNSCDGGCSMSINRVLSNTFGKAKPGTCFFCNQNIETVKARWKLKLQAEKEFEERNKK